MNRKKSCVEPSTISDSRKLVSERATASASATVASATIGGQSIGSAQTHDALAVETTPVALVGRASDRHLLSCGWYFESFDMGFRVGHQLSRDGVHLVLTVDADAPKFSLLPESALLEFLKESGVVLG